jgi:hypothetical protein
MDKNEATLHFHRQKNEQAKKTRDFPEFCQKCKQNSSSVLSDRFHRLWAQVHVPLLKSHFFSGGKARIFATDIKNQCFKN